MAAFVRSSDPRTIFWTNAQLHSSVAGMAFRPMTCSVSARVVMGCGVSRSTSWINRRHLPGRNQVLRPEASLLRHEVRIKQPRGAVEIHGIGTMLDDPLLQMAHNPAQLESLPAQSIHDARLAPSQLSILDQGFRMVTNRPYTSEQGRGGTGPSDTTKARLIPETGKEVS